MKIKFRDIRLSAANKRKLEIINSIIREYQGQGYVLTLRQLYYQLVSRDIIPNALPEYAKVSKLLKEGRLRFTVKSGQYKLRVCPHVKDIRTLYGIFY